MMNGSSSIVLDQVTFFAIPGKGLLVGDGKVCLVGRRSGLEGSGGHYDPVGRL